MKVNGLDNKKYPIAVLVKKSLRRANQKNNNDKFTI